MNFKWDLTKFIKEARAKKSAIAVLRKRSKDSIARPKATKNITSKDSRLQGISVSYTHLRAHETG